MKRYRVVSRRLEAENLTKKQAEEFVEKQGSIIDENEMIFLIQKE